MMGYDCDALRRLAYGTLWVRDESLINLKGSHCLDPVCRRARVPPQGGGDFTAGVWAGPCPCVIRSRDTRNRHRFTSSRSFPLSPPFLFNI